MRRESLLHATPENEEIGQRKRRQAHRLEAMRHRGSQAVEGGLEHKAVRDHPSIGDRLQRGRCAHRHAQQEDGSLPVAATCVSGGPPHILRFVEADARGRAPRASRSWKIDEK